MKKERVFLHTACSEIPRGLLLLIDPSPQRIAGLKPQMFCLTVGTGDTLFGAVLMEPDSERRILAVKGFGIYPAYRHQGHGEALLEEVLTYAKLEQYHSIRVLICSLDTNKLLLYQRLGFRISSIDADYYIKNYNNPDIIQGMQCRDAIELQYTILSEQERNTLAQNFWNSFIEKNREFIGRKYDLITFGNTEALANQLADLVVSGRKRATTSAVLLYEKEHMPLPAVGDLAIVTYGNGTPVCIIQNRKVHSIPFSAFNEDLARLEGEGDQSLDFWIDAHKKIFEQEFNAYGLDFSETSTIVVEEFACLWNGNSFAGEHSGAGNIK